MKVRLTTWPFSEPCYPFMTSQKHSIFFFCLPLTLFIMYSTICIPRRGINTLVNYDLRYSLNSVTSTADSLFLWHCCIDHPRMSKLQDELPKVGLSLFLFWVLSHQNSLHAPLSLPFPSPSVGNSVSIFSTNSPNLNILSPLPLPLYYPKLSLSLSLYIYVKQSP